MAKGRYNSFLKCYKDVYIYLYKVKRDSLTTGWGCTELDNAIGLFTIQQKQEHLCKFYQDIDNLFGSYT